MKEEEMPGVVGGPLDTVGEFFLYVYAVLYPFFVFAVFFARDSPATWIVGILTLLFLIRFFQSGGFFWTDRSLIYLSLLVLAYLSSTCAVYLSDLPYTWAGRTPFSRALSIDVRLLYVFLGFIVFTNFLANKPISVFERIFRVQLIVGVSIALFGLLQYVSFTVFDSTMFVGIKSTNESFYATSNIATFGKERVFRSSAFFSEPSFFGFFLIPLIVKAVLAWYKRIYIISKWFHATSIGILSLAILSNFSLTAILAIALLTFVSLIFAIRRSPRAFFTITFFATAFFVLLVLSPLGGAFFARLEGFLGSRDLSTLDRLLRAYSGFVVFSQNMWLGVGPGGFAFLYPKIGIVFKRTEMYTPLNTWFSLLCDVGILGFLPFAAFLGSVLLRAKRQIKNHPLTSVYFWSVLSYLILLSTLDLWFLDFFWFELALLLAIVTGAAQRNPPKKIVKNSNMVLG